MLLFQHDLAFLQSSSLVVQDRIRSRYSHHISSVLFARTAKKDVEAESTQESGSSPVKEDTVTIPYGGLMNYERGTLFNEPLKVYDPLDDIDDLPGEDGSDEKLEAIMKRLDDRVESIKSAGQWNDEEIENYGRDPLRNIPLPQIMLMQLRSIKPYDTPSDLLLTYVLVLLTTAVLGGYVVVLSDVVEKVVSWYVNTDFDSDFFSTLFAG